MNADKANSTWNIVKNVVVVVLILVGLMFTGLQLLKARRIRSENSAIEQLNDGQYQAALDMYLALLPKASSDDAKRLRKRIAECYVRLGDEPDKSMEERLEFYRQALEYDAEITGSDNIRKLLER